MLAMAVTVISTYLVAFAKDGWSMQAVIALAEAGPFVMIVGWFCNHLEPYSKLGWRLIVVGFNFFCGWLLTGLEPMHLYFGSVDSTGVLFLCLLLAIGLNSWQIFYHTDKFFYLRQVWNWDNKLPNLKDKS